MSQIRSPNRFSQFVGRAIRVNRQGGEEEPIMSLLISHKKFNQRGNFDKYREDKLIVEITEPNDELEN
eukprot:gene6106-10113_t